MDVVLFSHDVEYAQAAMAAGLEGVVVDWETTDKERRQSGYDTQIDPVTPEDLGRMRAALTGKVVCRIDNRPDRRAQQARLAVELGADEVWLPMVRSVREVQECLRTVDGQASLGVQVETEEALRLGRALDGLPLSRVYVGLNDLRIALRRDTIFDTLVDGTIERFRADYRGAFGVAGVTLPDRGAPLPQRLLLAEMARLGCSFGVARRAFRRDVPMSGLEDAMRAIGAAYRELLERDADAVRRDRASLIAAMRGPV